MMRTRKRYRSISKEKFKINYRDLAIILFIVIMTIIGIYFVKLSLDFDKTIKPIYSYTAEKSDDYEVLLKPNNYYTSEVLPSGRYYASKSVKQYMLEFKYHFYGDKEANIEYKYNITAELSGVIDGTNDNGKEVWNRVFNILEDKKQDGKNEFYVDEKVNIDYEYYNNLARSYEKEYGIAINSILKVYLNISYNVNPVGINVDTEEMQDYIELDIPITNTVTEVDEKYENTTAGNINPKIENIVGQKAMLYALGGVCIIAVIVVIILRIRKGKQSINMEDLYQKNINKILKYYKDLIVTIENEPDITNLKIMNVTTIDDLIDVAEQNKSNIIHYEFIKSRVSKLYVIAGEYVYIYEITANKIK